MSDHEAGTCPACEYGDHKECDAIAFPQNPCGCPHALAAPNQYEQQYARVADTVEQAEHDAEVAAKALREAAGRMRRIGWDRCAGALEVQAAALAPDADTTDGGDPR